MTISKTIIRSIATVAAGTVLALTAPVGAANAVPSGPNSTGPTSNRCTSSMMWVGTHWVPITSCRVAETQPPVAGTTVDDHSAPAG
jgi:hypothetical protein